MDAGLSLLDQIDDIPLLGKLRKLSQIEIQILELLTLHDLTEIEIGKIIGQSQQNISHRIGKIREKLMKGKEF